MSSRLFQNIREKRGLSYSVFSGINAYRDAGSLTVYAGCANEAVGEVIDLTVEEMKGHQADAGGRHGAAPREGPPQGQRHVEPGEHRQPDVASRAAGDLLRSAVQPRRDARGIERVTPEDIQRVARNCFRTARWRPRCWARSNGLQLPQSDAIVRPGDLEINDPSLHSPRHGAHLERRAAIRDLAAGRNCGCPSDGDAGIIPNEAARDIASGRNSTSLASPPSKKSPSTTSSRLPPPWPSTWGRRRVGCISASRRQTSSIPHRRCRCARRAISSSGTWSRWPSSPGEGRGAPRHADDRPHARRSRRAHDVRAEAGAVVRGAQAGRRANRRARAVVSVGKISGAVGTYAHLDPSIEAGVCRALGLEPAPVSSQVIQRDRHAELMKRDGDHRARRSKSSRSKCGGFRRQKSARWRSRSARGRRARPPCRTSATQSGASRSPALRGCSEATRTRRWKTWRCGTSATSPTPRWSA